MRVRSRAPASGRPIPLTQHGRSAAVLEDARRYQERLERYRFLEAVFRGVRDIEAGRVDKPETVIEELERIVDRHENVPCPAVRSRPTPARNPRTNP